MAPASNGTPGGNELGPAKTGGGTGVCWFKLGPEAKEPGAVEEVWDVSVISGAARTLDEELPLSAKKAVEVGGAEDASPSKTGLLTTDGLLTLKPLEIDLLLGGLTSIWQS